MVGVPVGQTNHALHSGARPHSEHSHRVSSFSRRIRVLNVDTEGVLGAQISYTVMQMHHLTQSNHITSTPGLTEFQSHHTYNSHPSGLDWGHLYLVVKAHRKYRIMFIHCSHQLHCQSVYNRSSRSPVWSKVNGLKWWLL